MQHCQSVDCAVLYLLYTVVFAIPKSHAGSKRASVQMEELYYWNVEYIDFQYFPVLFDDYNSTSDRPECEKPTTDPYFEEQVHRLLLLYSAWPVPGLHLPVRAVLFCLSCTIQECEAHIPIDLLLHRISYISAGGSNTLQHLDPECRKIVIYSIQISAEITV